MPGTAHRHSTYIHTRKREIYTERELKKSTSSQPGMFVLVQVERAHAQLARMLLDVVQQPKPLRDDAEVRTSVHIGVPALRNELSQILPRGGGGGGGEDVNGPRLCMYS